MIINDNLPDEILDIIEETYFFIKDLSQNKAIKVDSLAGLKLINEQKKLLMEKLNQNSKLATAIVTFVSNLVIYKHEGFYH